MEREDFYRDDSSSIIIQESDEVTHPGRYSIYRLEFDNVKPTLTYKECEFDSLGTEIKVIINRIEDTLNIIYNPIYDKNKKLLYKTMICNGIKNDDIIYTYKNRTITYHLFENSLVEFISFLNSNKCFII